MPRGAFHAFSPTRVSIVGDCGGEHVRDVRPLRRSGTLSPSRPAERGSSGVGAPPARNATLSSTCATSCSVADPWSWLVPPWEDGVEDGVRSCINTSRPAATPQSRRRKAGVRSRITTSTPNRHAARHSAPARFSRRPPLEPTQRSRRAPRGRRRPHCFPRRYSPATPAPRRCTRRPLHPRKC